MCDGALHRLRVLAAINRVLHAAVLDVEQGSPRSRGWAGVEVGEWGQMRRLRARSLTFPSAARMGDAFPETSSVRSRETAEISTAHARVTLLTLRRSWRRSWWENGLEDARVVVEARGNGNSEQINRHFSFWVPSVPPQGT